MLALLVTAGAVRAESTDHEELQAQQRTVDKHLLRVQQERFEARARGESPKTLRRLDREFQRTQARRRDLMRAIDTETGE